MAGFVTSRLQRVQQSKATHFQRLEKLRYAKLEAMSERGLPAPTIDWSLTWHRGRAYIDGFDCPFADIVSIDGERWRIFDRREDQTAAKRYAGMYVLYQARMCKYNGIVRHGKGTPFKTLFELRCHIEGEGLEDD